MFARILYWVVKNSYFVFFKVFNKLEIMYPGRVPRTRPVILASNHSSNLDPPVIGSVFKDRLRYIAKASLFSPAPFGFVLRTLGAVPVSREDETKAGMILKMFLRFLEKEENVLIFPEGKRSPDGHLQPLEGGVALLSLKSKRLVVPVYIRGTFLALPSGKSFPRAVKITVNYGFPIDPAEIPVGVTDKEARSIFLERLDDEYRRLERETGESSG